MSKKGVFEDLAEFAKKYKKIAILTSKMPKKLYFSALRGFLNEKNLDFIVYEFNDNLENYENSIKASASCKNCDLIVALGAGTISNFAKLTTSGNSNPVSLNTASTSGYICLTISNNTVLSFPPENPHCIALEKSNTFSILFKE